MCSRPAVSTMTVSYPSVRASCIAPRRARHRVEVARRVVHPHARLLRHQIQLLDRGRTTHVRGHDDRVLPLLDQPLGQLAGGGRLARALQPEHQNHARRCALAGGRPPCVSPNSASISSRTMRTTCCTGAEALEHLVIDGAITHLVDERLDDLEVDVGFEQRHADFPQGHFHRLRRQAHLSPEVGEDVLEAIAERVEHHTRPPGPPGGPVANHESSMGYGARG